MAQDHFIIRTEVLDCVDEGNAIATAAAYLAYCDTTDTIGYNPSISNNVVHTNSSGPIAVTLRIGVNIQDDDHLKLFMDELANMSKVLSVEREGVSVI